MKNLKSFLIKLTALRTNHMPLAAREGYHKKLCLLNNACKNTQINTPTKITVIRMIENFGIYITDKSTIKLATYNKKHLKKIKELFEISNNYLKNYLCCINSS